MIHVLNFNSQIIDFISRDDNAVTIAKYHKTKDNDLLDIRILSQRAEHFKKRNRIIIQDKNGVYREYIIDRAEEDGRYVDVECTASHLVDISTSKPIPPGKYEKMTINQKLSETLRDSGWVVGDCDYAGLKTNSWTSVRTPLEMISQLETAHEVQADYEIEIDGYEVVERRVNMKIPAPLFKGKEIEYGKDLLSMKRVIDFSEVKTALFALGPEPEQGKRVETFVYDDEAQKQFDLPYRYIWGVYEPETEDDNMSLQRLTTLAKTELNKRKSAAVSYEISVVDIEKEFPHEVIRYGDIVRIKNPDFTPTLYAESEVIGIEHDLISNKCTYEFGKVVEYQEDDLLRYFRNRLGYFNQKFNDKFSNVNTIVRESIEGELQYFERKILKGDTPPENPINDLLWLDTSNPKIPVLRRYFNGEWIKSSAENASDVGAITREQAMYSGLSNTFINLTIQHSRLLKEVSEIVESEYFVDVELKKEVNDKLNATVDVFNHIKTNLDSMNEKTATIGKLIDTQALFVDYREKMQSLYNAVENAKIAIDERFKLLQSQYTDEKFNEAMEKVASALPNGHWDSDNKQLTSDVPNEARLKEIEKVLKENVSELDKTLKNYTDSAVLKTRNELSASVRDIDEKVENLQFGGRNLLLGTNDLLKFVRMVGAKGDRSLESSETSRTGNMVKVTNIVRTSSSSVVGFNFKDIAPLFGVDLEEYVLSFYLKTNSEQKVNFLAYNTETISVTPKLISDKFQRVIIRLRPKALKKDVPHHNGNLYLVGENLTDLWIYDIKLEKGLIPTDWTPAPEDTENAINNVSNSLEPIKIRTTNAENSIKVLQDSLLLTATKTDVQRTLDEQLKPLKNEVNEQKAQLQVMSDSIDSKVSQSEYTSNLQGVVERLDNAETHRQQLSNQITDRVTRSEYENDVEQRLVNSKAEVLIEAEQTSNRVSKEVFNESSKTLEKYTSEFINNVSTGMSFNYDNNGNIQSANVGPDGIKFDTTKFIINDGDVIIQNGVTTIKDAYIDKLFSKQATIEYLKATDIDLNRATVKGSKNGESTVLTGGKIRSTGSFVRTFPQGSVTYEAFTESWNGVYRAGLISKQFGNRKLTDIERWLALTDKTITTQREIHSMSPDKRGARFIDFFAEETYSSDVFGQGMHVYSGQDLKIEAGYRLSFESSNSWYTQFLGGGVEVVNDGASLVLKRQSGFTSQAGSGGQYIMLQAYDGAEHGHLGILSNNRHLSLKSSFGEVHLRGNQVKALNSEGNSLTTITASDFDISGVGRVVFENGDAYLQGQTGVRFTRYKSNTFVTAQAKDFVKASSRHLKTNIEDLKNGLETINQLKPVKYDYISDLQEGNTDGDIGFIAEDSPSISVNNGKAISVQKIATWAILGIQELSKENDDLQKQIADLKTKFDVLSEVIK
ncbi:phage tail protein [Staphylococcus pseudintermedius]|nr:phage tail protein [Staphylococcus pseudintermedius]